MFISAGIVTRSSQNILVGAAVAFLAAGCALRPVAGPTAIQAPKSPPVDPRALAKQIGFPEQLVVSMGTRGTNLRRLIGTDSKGMEKPAPGLVIDVSGGDWHETVRNLRGEVAPGYLVFCRKQGFARWPDEIALLRGSDQFDALRAVGTSGPNYDIAPEEVLRRVLAWHRAFGLDVVGAGDDWMEADFRRPPADMDAFAREVYKFCPDVVDQGTGSVGELAREMKHRNSVYLWWD